jgi:release factor glutamine methyltransferase
MSHTDRWDLRRVLDWTRAYFERRGLDSPRLDAELLIAHAQGIDRVRLYMNLDKPLSAEELTHIRALIERRAQHEPAAYIMGTRGFWTLDLAVDGRVLVPRPETERLVELALKHLKTLDAPRIVDVGTGSGAIALALASELPEAEVHAIDVSTDALAVARANAETNGLERVRFHHGDLLAPVVNEAPFHMVVSNPPYIPSGDLPGLMPDVRDFEPHLALDGGPDGLDIVRRLISAAHERLAPGGRLMMEIGHDQGPAVAALCGAPRFDDATVHPDYAGLDRIVEAVRT